MASGSIRQRAQQENVWNWSDLQLILRKTVLYALMLIAIVWSVGPLFWVFSTSLKPDRETLAFTQTILPQNPTLDNYTQLFKVTKFGTWMRNSAVMATTTTVAVVLLSSMAAYALSRFSFRGFPPLQPPDPYGVYDATDHSSCALVLIATQLESLEFAWLGWGWSITATRLPFGIWLLRSYYAGIPVEIEEAAMVDGATRFQTFYRIIFIFRRSLA